MTIITVEDSRVEVNTPFPEQTAWTYGGDLVDQANAPLTAANLATLTLRIYNDEDAAKTDILGSTNILNADRGTLDAAGKLAVDFRPADSALVDATKRLERHIALLEWSWIKSGVTFRGRREIVHRIRNLNKV